MIFSAQELLSHAADALLAAHGLSTPVGKWRVRQLAGLPPAAEKCLPGRSDPLSLRDQYVTLHRAPPDLDDAGAVHRHALQIAHFARRALLFAECELFSPARRRLPSFDEPAPVPGSLLPHLDLDVTLRGHELQIYRLQGSGEVISLSPEGAALLCLFDSRTSEQAAAALAEPLFGVGQGGAAIQELRALVAHAQLAARPLIDEGALSRLLGRI
jgi:hypothetical protein